jgi:hypothetical protein
MAALAPGEDGLIDLSNGYTAVETTPPRRRRKRRNS